MEGGLLSWKRLPPDKVKYWDPKEALKPLPSPPPGWVWVRLPNGVYELMDARSSPDAANEEKEEEKSVPEMVEHVVVASDTLAGLRLRYGVSATELRRHNAFEGENFRMCEVLRIPRGKGKRRRPQEDTLEVKLQRIRNATRLGAIEARFYLDQAGGDVAAAIRAAQADCEFEAAARTPIVLQARRAVVVHFDSATDLRDAGLLGPMDVYAVAELWAGTSRIAEGTSCAVRGAAGAWRWCPTQSGASVDLPYDDAQNLALAFEIKSPNDLMPDTRVGRTKRLPLSRLVDSALHAVTVDSGGALHLSLKAPPDVARDAVRAVALFPDDNPFLPYPDSPPLVTAVAVRVDDPPINANNNNNNTTATKPLVLV
ncbi:hypothetical protein CTAYLR_009869 [Chrysophaeum taylorii]|uniref:LysM domain-containing protein n=1 Tax=Chrysophaeum taylorii TaxID=2483200 RepID=A0AAD7U6N9_9STRA|nr:hypothetical protein CTAYLR_009869 [Chrysophaeum taylorii]